jgi:hypothetical protein
MTSQRVKRRHETEGREEIVVTMGSVMERKNEEGDMGSSRN